MLNLNEILERFPPIEPQVPARGRRGAQIGAGLGMALGAGRNRDTELIAVEPGEYVFSKKAAQQIGYDNLDRMNNTGKIHWTTYGPGSPNPTGADLREFIGAYDNPLRPGDIALHPNNPWGIKPGPNSYFGGRHVADVTADWVPRNTVDVYYPPPPGYGIQPRRYQGGGVVGDEPFAEPTPLPGNIGRGPMAGARTPEDFDRQWRFEAMLNEFLRQQAMNEEVPLNSYQGGGIVGSPAGGSGGMGGYLGQLARMARMGRMGRMGRRGGGGRMQTFASDIEPGDIEPGILPGNERGGGGVGIWDLVNPPNFPNFPGNYGPNPNQPPLNVYNPPRNNPFNPDPSPRVIAETGLGQGGPGLGNYPGILGNSSTFMGGNFGPYVAQTSTGDYFIPIYGG